VTLLERTLVRDLRRIVARALGRPRARALGRYATKGLGRSAMRVLGRSTVGTLVENTGRVPTASAAGILARTAMTVGDDGSVRGYVGRVLAQVARILAHANGSSRKRVHYSTR
jgi:hypothetical protein